MLIARDGRDKTLTTDHGMLKQFSGARMDICKTKGNSKYDPPKQRYPTVVSQPRRPLPGMEEGAVGRYVTS
jgi:hypothetical protein